MKLLVDTSVWSLALRRDCPPDLPEVRRLRGALLGGDDLFTTGMVLEELLQGFTGPHARDRIVARFAALPYLVPDRTDHIAAAELRVVSRRAGIRIGTIDALLAALCIRYDLTLLSADEDFRDMREVCDLAVWGATWR